MAEINLLREYPRSQRPIDERGQQVSEADRAVARRFDRLYFDGTRLQGYGGYSYHPRFWEKTVQVFRDHYHLTEQARILDVGCAKGFMLHDFKRLMPKLEVAGIDISSYAIEQAMESVRPFLKVGNATQLPFPDQSFDCVISINTIHNLAIEDCKRALREIQRVARKNAFICVDAWRTDDERARLLKWNLTALTYMHVDDWKAVFAETGYTGDYYWFIP